MAGALAAVAADVAVGKGKIIESVPYEVPRREKGGDGEGQGKRRGGGEEKKKKQKTIPFRMRRGFNLINFLPDECEFCWIHVP